MNNLVLAITGASGAVYALRLLDVLLAAGKKVHLTLSSAAAQVIEQELGLRIDLDNFDPAQLQDKRGQVHFSGESVCRERNVNPKNGPVPFYPPPGEVIYHHYLDFSAGIASGSFLTEGMAICPCSMGTLASLANGQSANLIHRAADVHLKERRKLVVVPRETPLGSIQLRNMQRLSDAGAVILPAMPGFYHNPQSIRELIDFVVGRICDHLGIEHSLYKRWGGETG